MCVCVCVCVCVCARALKLLLGVGYGRAGGSSLRKGELHPAGAPLPCPRIASIGLVCVVDSIALI